MAVSQQWLAQFDKDTPENQATYLTQLAAKDPAKAARVHDAHQAYKAGAVGQGEAALRGGAQGVTAGFSDEIAGGMDALGMTPTDAVMSAANPFAAPAIALGRGAQRLVKHFTDPNDDIVADYTKGRDASRARNTRAQEDNPWTYGGSELAGGVLGTALMPAEGLAGMVGQGAALGATGGLGHSKADLTKGDISGAAVDTALGGIGGAAGGLVGYGMSKPARSVGNYLQESGEHAAFSAMHPALKDYKALTGEEQRAIGRRALDENIVNFGSSSKNIANNAAPIREQAGQAVSNMVKKIQAEANAQGRKLDVNAVADRLEAELMPRVDTSADRDLAAQVHKEIQNLREHYSPESGREFSFDKFAEEKTKQAAKGNFDTAVAGRTTKTSRAISHQMGEGIKDEANAISPELSNQYLAAKTRYHELAPAERIAEASADRFDKNNTIGLPDIGLASIGASIAGGPGAALGLLGSKVLKERGTAASAVIMDSLGKIISGGGPMAKVAKMLGQNPNAFGPFLPKLLSAAARGPDALRAEHEALNEAFPGYRQKLKTKSTELFQ